MQNTEIMPGKTRAKVEVSMGKWGAKLTKPHQEKSGKQSAAPACGRADK